MPQFTALSGYGFDEKGAYLRLDHHENGTINREIYHLEGKEFTLKAEFGRYCTGRFDLKTLTNHVCPDAAELLSPKANVCFDCFDFIGFNPAFYHLEQHQISPQQSAYNQTEHIVYLSFFAPGLIKVGISSSDRKEHRWKEQGARVVAHIFTVPNAYEARHIEETISKQLQLPEVVLGKKKRALLTAELNLTDAQSELKSLCDRITLEIGKSIAKNQIYSMDEYYNPSGTVLHKTIIDVTDHVEGKISGKFLGLYGDILLLENANQQFMCSLKRFISFKVTMTQTQEKMNFEPQQISLF